MLEIVVAVLIIGVVIGLTRLWSTATEESPSQATPTPRAPAYFWSNDSDPNWLLYQAAPDDATQNNATPHGSGSSSAAPMPIGDPVVIDHSSQLQDCSQQSGTDNSAGDWPCPADSTGYDRSGCSVDSSTFSSDSN